MLISDYHVLDAIMHIIQVGSVVAELAKTFFFVLTLGQTGTGVLSDTWPLCLSHHLFCNIVYNLSNFVFYTELNARLPIVMIIKQLN